MIAEDDNREEGTGWTAADLLRTGERHRLALEAMRLDSTRANRAVLGLPTRARELLVQLSVRLSL